MDVTSKAMTSIKIMTMKKEQAQSALVQILEAACSLTKDADQPGNNDSKLANEVFRILGTYAPVPGVFR